MTANEPYKRMAAIEAALHDIAWCEVWNFSEVLEVGTDTGVCRVDCIYDHYVAEYVYRVRVAESRRSEYKPYQLLYCGHSVAVAVQWVKRCCAPLSYMVAEKAG